MTRSRQRGGRRPQPSHGHNPNRTFDSSGPEIKIRGSASHVYEKYLQMARDANTSGDRVAAENYLQHAEHYFRLMASAQAQQQYQARNQGGNGGANGRTPAQSDAGPQPATSEPSFSLAESRTVEGAGSPGVIE